MKHQATLYQVLIAASQIKPSACDYEVTIRLSRPSGLPTDWQIPCLAIYKAIPHIEQTLSPFGAPDM